MAEKGASRGRSTRMTGRERREQLVAVGRQVFAEKGFDMSSVEEIAARATVSKPIVYEHFGGKEGLYAVVVDREVSTLLADLERSLSDQRAHPRLLMERAALAFLSYIDENEAGFRILVRDSPVSQAGGTFSSLLTDVAQRVEDILAAQLKMHSYPTRDATLYAQMLVGMVAYTGQWWVETRTPTKEVVAARMVNLSWYGLVALQKEPTLRQDARG
ncbi:TetR/AcrR family transcriptional regulator [Brachybacterium alimentarium]|uniref:TetR family transcriptional regulator n=2 Tax=Brachybacterium alimentarium TaxID=47845 RepID=A0A2A3YIU3_9MICO|nr:TetR/AcrR family transcriptional regulator [Brachybacterium alimentarium]PCC31587.1 TetR family transcriptional regulator [Brachybacterium alimentarium]PCC39672.1 TetR family transcriptional regulator [Brachybacterium alimentarium]RCS64116.1 TetR/AcrR family transcriptional regulator [Brachybacterium alimentarium]RCS76468.1 TetR/AcrR family transcriptional regulator [Brachybacterium alimentarium]RCS79679.1 TetR/AcrR family transcriptional regulator [Brachybacterium alimentarium]